MKFLFNKKLAGILIIIIALMPSVVFAVHSPNNIYAKVLKADDSSFTDAEITITVTDGNGEIAIYPDPDTTTPPNDVIVYDAANSLITIVMANFTAQWAANDSLTIKVDGAGETGTTTTTITGSTQNFATDTNLDFKTAAGATDTTPPVITLLGDATGKICQGATYTDAGATANDDTDGDITANIVTTGTVDTATPADYTITYNVSDAATNAATPVTRTVTVVATASCDAEVPVITLGGAATMDVCKGTTYTDAGATAIDNFDGDITANIVTTGTVDTATVGTYNISYNVSDAFGNAAAPVTRTVTVKDCSAGDTIAPTITLTGAASVNVCLNAAYTDAGATANDNVDGDITANIAKTGTVDTATAGTYTLTYNVSDTAGNAAAPVTRSVVVADCTTVTLGDADGNGTVDINDALLVAKYDVGLPVSADDINLANANVDCSGTVPDIYDALKIAKFDAGLVTELVCP